MLISWGKVLTVDVLEPEVLQVFTNGLLDQPGQGRARLPVRAEPEDRPPELVHEILGELDGAALNGPVLGLLRRHQDLLPEWPVCS
jgi:hypothetical protein